MYARLHALASFFSAMSTSAQNSVWPRALLERHRAVLGIYR